MFNPFRRKKVEVKADMRIYDYELLSRLFGMEEAKKHLLNVVVQKSVGPDEVLRDAQSLDSMMQGYGWKVYENAAWLKLLTSLRLSLSAKTIEEREAGRNRVLICLEMLHLPYEMKYASDNIKKMKELEKSFKDTHDILTK